MKEFLKKSRMGFTLVELLIAIVILSALTATWMLSPGDSIISAKVDRLVHNMMAIKDAALLYLSYNPDRPEISDFKNNIKKYLGDIAASDVTLPKNTIISDEYRYEIYDGQSGYANCWRVQCVFAGDPDRDKIRVKLEKLAPSLKLYYRNIGIAYSVKNEQESDSKHKNEYKVVLRIN